MATAATAPSAARSDAFGVHRPLTLSSSIESRTRSPRGFSTPHAKHVFEMGKGSVLRGAEARGVRVAIDDELERRRERDAATIDAGDRADTRRRRDGVEQREDRAAVRGTGQALEPGIERDDARRAVAAGGALQDRVRRERGGIGHREVGMR